MNKRTLRLVTCGPLDHTHSERMSAGGVFHRPYTGDSVSKRANPLSDLTSPVSVGFIRSTPNAASPVHGRSNGLRGYRTLAEAGRRLGGLSATEVEALVEGPLVGREVYGELLIHDDDLQEFMESRRPRLAGGAQ